MTAPPATTPPRIADALRRAHELAGWSPQPPAFRGPRPVVMPVPLREMVGGWNVVVEEMDALTGSVAGARLSKEGLELPALINDPSPLAGFVVAAPDFGLILANRDDALARRRFTIAHELGHLLLHCPENPGADGAAPWLMSDAPELVNEAVLSDAGEDGPDAPVAGLSLKWQEREANRFAAELLMPEPVVLALYDYYAGHFGTSPRYLEGHIAGDLLVSRQAVQFRLADLGKAG